MLSASRKVAFVFLAALALAATGCGSDNKGKIEGRWKFVSFPAKDGQHSAALLAKLEKVGGHFYIEFRPDGTLTTGIGADKQETLDLFKGLAATEGKKISADGKYKLLSGDGVELYDLTPDLQTSGGGLFGSKDRARVKVKITGDAMEMTDDSGTAKLTKTK